MKKKLVVSLFLLLGGAVNSFAQESSYVERTRYEKSNDEVLNFFKRITIGGVVQAQWQLGQAKGMDGGPSSAGAFPAGSNSRFMLRRGYLKVAYESKYFASTIQINATADGVSLVNAFAQVNTASKSAALRLGSIYKPFGYFVSYPSGSRLTPEVSRSEQTLFPDATGAGARVMLRDTRDKWTRDFAIDLCLFNGTMNGADNFAGRDFIGKIEYTRPVGKMLLGAQFSILKGSMVNVADKYFSFDDFDNPQFITVDNMAGKRVSKSYYSFGAMVGFKSGIGETKIMGEYILGNQLSLVESNITPSRRFYATADDHLYKRNFANYYIFAQHKIVNTNLTVIARLDSVDPNVKVGEDNIGTMVGTTIADIKYTTFGFGLSYNFFKYMSALAYYEIVGNEQCTAIKGYDLNRKDNLFTLRLQCYF